MLDELIRKMEEEATDSDKKSPSFGNKLRYLQHLFDTTEQIGKLELNNKEEHAERYFCYERKKNAGHVIEKNKLGISMSSYGNISKEDFIDKHFKIEPPEADYAENVADKLSRIPYTLMAVPIMLLPAAFYAAKKVYERKQDDEPKPE